MFTNGVSGYDRTVSQIHLSLGYCQLIFYTMNRSIILSLVADILADFLTV